MNNTNFNEILTKIKHIINDLKVTTVTSIMKYDNSEVSLYLASDNKNYYCGIEFDYKDKTIRLILNKVNSNNSFELIEFIEKVFNNNQFIEIENFIIINVFGEHEKYLESFSLQSNSYRVSW